MKSKTKIKSKNDIAVDYLKSAKLSFTKLKHEFGKKKKTLKHRAYVNILAIIEDRLEKRAKEISLMPEDMILDIDLIQEDIYGNPLEFFMRELEKGRP